MEGFGDTPAWFHHWTVIPHDDPSTLHCLIPSLSPGSCCPQVASHRGSWGSLPCLSFPLSDRGIFRVVISHAPLAWTGEAACFWEAGVVEVNRAWKTAGLAASIPGDPEAPSISCRNCSLWAWRARPAHPCPDVWAGCQDACRKLPFI